MAKKALQSVDNTVAPKLGLVVSNDTSTAVVADARLLENLCETIADGDAIAGLESLNGLSRAARGRLVEFLHQQALLMNKASPDSVEQHADARHLH